MFEQYREHVHLARLYRRLGDWQERDFHLLMAEVERRNMLNGPNLVPIGLESFKEFLETRH